MMVFMFIVLLLIIVGLSLLAGIGLAQAASKQPKSTYKVNHVTDELMRQAINDAGRTDCCD